MRCVAETAGGARRAGRRGGWLAVMAVAFAGSALCAPRSAPAQAGKPPLGLPAVPVPQDNPQSAGKIALGKQLYFDRRLSIDNTVSCADCHAPDKGWSNAAQFATGIEGKQGARNAPTILNTAYQKFQFWDGRAGSLEEQALGPIQNPIEMALSLEEMERRLNAIEGYRRQFKQVFGADKVTRENVAKAIAAFERTVLSGNSPYDRFKAGETQALSAAARRGMELFFGKANCSACHTGPNFTDNAFHNIGIGMDAKEPDKGREEVSKMLGDRGSFKTPTVRDVALTGPYMHDGSLKTLEEVIEHYVKGGIPNPQLDEEIFPLKLTAEQKADLVTFLKEGLASNPYPTAEPPELPK